MPPEERDLHLDPLPAVQRPRRPRQDPGHALASDASGAALCRLREREPVGVQESSVVIGNLHLLDGEQAAGVVLLVAVPFRVLVRDGVVAAQEPGWVSTLHADELDLRTPPSTSLTSPWASPRPSPPAAS
jgi:hypothetical protein